MKLSHILAYSVIILTTISFPAFSQKKIVFGKVSMEEMQMNSYPKDTTAGAVILSDIGKFNGNESKFTRHIRVKILRKSGLDWGNWVINTPSKSDFRVWVFNLDDELIVTEKATSKSIYTEELIKGFEVYKVFAPSVRVGSVIDISYSHFGLPFEWRFQERIPILYSDITIEPSNFILYTKTFYGFEPIQTKSQYQWTASDMPAFIIEPFINNYTNYITKFSFQIESVKIGGGMYGVSFFEINSSWTRINDLLLTHSKFGGILNESGFLNDFAKELKSKKLSTEETINEAYKYIQKNIKWNGTKALLATAEIRNNFISNHSGNSAEVNLLLVSLLRKAGLTANPIVLSTRDNGLILKHAPAIDRLNYVIALVQEGEFEIILDATSSNLAPNKLPDYCLNGSGLIVKKNEENWYLLNKNAKKITKQFIHLLVESNGTTTGKITNEYLGQSYFGWAEDIKNKNADEEILKSRFQDGNSEIIISSYSLKRNDAIKSSGVEVLDIDMTNSVIANSNELLFNPFVLFEYLKNPFLSESRKYPVDFGCPMELQTTIVVQLPKDHSVNGLTPSTKLTTEDGQASFTYFTNSTGNNLQFKAILSLSSYVYTETQYQDLRRFFSEVAKIVNTHIQAIGKT